MQRIQELQTALKEAQLMAASQTSLLKQSQQQQQQMHHLQSSEQNHIIEDLRLRMNEQEVEIARLRNSLKSEEKVKQDLLGVYHKSLKEITELNGALLMIQLNSNQLIDLIWVFFSPSSLCSNADTEGVPNRGYANAVGHDEPEQPLPLPDGG